MKNKELEVKINEMVDTLTDTMKQITNCEMANESLVTEIHNLKTKIELLENENEHLLERNDDLNDTIKDLRSQVETPVVERLSIEPFNPYKNFPGKTRIIITELRDTFKNDVTDVKSPSVKSIIWKHEGINSSICNVLRTMSNRRLPNGGPLVTLTTTVRGGKNQISTFKFNF